MSDKYVKLLILYIQMPFRQTCKCLKLYSVVLKIKDIDYIYILNIILGTCKFV